MVNGDKLTTDFKERDYETLNGQTIRWDIEQKRRGRNSRSYKSGGFTDGFDVDGYRVIDQQNGKKRVIIGNLRAKNGVVHVIDEVLLPRN